MPEFDDFDTQVQIDEITPDEYEMDDFQDDDFPEYDDDFSDADALASAGWGTDEDYGGYGDDY